MGDPIIIFLIVIAVIAVGAGLTWHTLHRRYVQAIESRGWRWHGGAPAEITIGLNNAPFGLGFGRKAGHFIEGVGPQGAPFKAFEYSSDAGSFSGLAIAMQLPKSLPALHIFPAGQPRPGVAGAQLAAEPYTVVAPDPRFGERALSALQPHLAPIAVPSGGSVPIDLSIDHNHIVLLGAPKKVEDLEACVTWLAAAQQALVSSAAMEFTGSEPPTYLSFAGRGEWRYIPQDNSYLRRVDHDRSGFDHEAVDIVVSDNYGLPFVRLHHKWKTRHTRRDAQGRTTTEIRHHDEYLCQFATTFPFAELSVNWGLFSGPVTKFESEQFNKTFKVRAAVSRFASDVMHPRQMEYMLHTRVPSFAIGADGSIRVRDGGRWYPEDIDATAHFLRGFFGNVPPFVWKELGADRPPQLEPPGIDRALPGS